MFKCFHPSLGMIPVKIGCKSNKDKQESKALKIEQLLFQSPVLFLLNFVFSRFLREILHSFQAVVIWINQILYWADKDKY